MPTRPSGGTLREVFGSVIPQELFDNEFEGLSSHIGRLSTRQRKFLTARCSSALKTPLVRVTTTRVAICKVLCAAAPESAAVIRELLKWQDEKDRYEIQFSLLCFLDELPGLARARPFAREIPRLIETYLMNARTNTGRAAWMAGHMLGDHWPRRREAVTVLANVVLRGRYSAGRRAASMALERMLSDTLDQRTRKRISRVLGR